MPVNRRQFLEDGALAVAAWKLRPEAGAQKPSGTGTDNHPTYGSGYFGGWIEDEWALPAFEYRCDQINDTKARTDLNPGILGASEHIHQVGNDRIVAVASNYGHVRVRQDEGAPKFLNDYAPERGYFGGGFGYLTDGNATLISSPPSASKKYGALVSSTSPMSDSMNNRRHGLMLPLGGMPNFINCLFLFPTIRCLTFCENYSRKSQACSASGDLGFFAYLRRLAHESYFWGSNPR